MNAKDLENKVKTEAEETVDTTETAETEGNAVEPEVETVEAELVEEEPAA